MRVGTARDVERYELGVFQGYHPNVPPLGNLQAAPFRSAPRPLADSLWRKVGRIVIEVLMALACAALVVGMLLAVIGSKSDDEPR